MKRICIVLALIATGCHSSKTTSYDNSKNQKAWADQPTAAEASWFMDELESELLDLWIAHERAEWVKATFITHDTDLLAAKANEDVKWVIKHATRTLVKAGHPDVFPLLGYTKTLALTTCQTFPYQLARVTSNTNATRLKTSPMA